MVPSLLCTSTEQTGWYIRSHRPQAACQARALLTLMRATRVGTAACAAMRCAASLSSARWRMMRAALYCACARWSIPVGVSADVCSANSSSQCASLHTHDQSAVIAYQASFLPVLPQTAACLSPCDHHAPDCTSTAYASHNAQLVPLTPVALECWLLAMCPGHAEIGFCRWLFTLSPCWRLSLQQVGHASPSSAGWT